MFLSFRLHLFVRIPAFPQSILCCVLGIQVIVEPAEQTVPEGTPFAIRCHVPGHPKIPLSWRRADGSQLNPEAGNGRGASIQVTRARLTDAGDYVCTAHPPGQRQVDSSPATVIVNPEEKPKPETTSKS